MKFKVKTSLGTYIVDADPSFANASAEEQTKLMIEWGFGEEKPPAQKPKKYEAKQTVVPPMGMYGAVSPLAGKTITTMGPTKEYEAFQNEAKKYIDSITDLQQLESYKKDPEVADDKVIQNYIKGREVELGGGGLGAKIGSTFLTKEGVTELYKGEEVPANLLGEMIGGPTGASARSLGSAVRGVLGPGARAVLGEEASKVVPTMEFYPPTTNKALLFSEEMGMWDSFTEQRNALIRQRDEALKTVNDSINKINSKTGIDPTVKGQMLLALNKTKSEIIRTRSTSENMLGAKGSIFLGNAINLAAQITLNAASGDLLSAVSLAKGVIKNGPKYINKLFAKGAGEAAEAVEAGVKAPTGIPAVEGAEPLTEEYISGIRKTKLEEVPTGKFETTETVRPEFKYNVPITKTGREQALGFERQALETQQQNLPLQRRDIQYMDRVPAIDPTTGKEMPGAFNFIDRRTGKVLEETAVLPSEKFTRTRELTEMRELTDVEKTKKIQNAMKEQLKQERARLESAKKIERAAEKTKIRYQDPKSKKLIEEQGLSPEDVDAINETVGLDEARLTQFQNDVANEYTTPGNLSKKEGSLVDTISKAITRLRDDVDELDVTSDILYDPRFTSLMDTEMGVKIDPIKFSSKDMKAKNMFDQLAASDTDAEAAKIIESYIGGVPESSIVNDIRNNVLDIARGKNVTADIIREAEKKLNNLIRNVAKSPMDVNLMEKQKAFLKRLKSYLTENRKAQVKEAIGESAWKDYKELEDIAVKELNDQKNFIEQLAKGRVESKSQVENVKNSVASKLMEAIEDSVRQGVNYRPDFYPALRRIAKLAGEQNFDRKFKALVLDRRFLGQAHLEKNVPFKPEDIYLKGKAGTAEGILQTGAKIAAEAPFYPMWRTKYLARVILLFKKGDVKLNFKRVNEILKERKDGDMFAAMLLGTNASNLARAFYGEPINDLKEQYSGDPEISNKLKAVESIMGSIK